MADAKSKKVQEAISSIQSEPEQIDAIQKIRNWFGPEKDSSSYAVVQEYLSGNGTADEAIKKLGEVSSKGKKEDISWDLQLGILHSAKRIPWTDSEGHTKLIDLIKTLKGPEANPTIVDWGMAIREVINDSPGVGSGFSNPENHAWTNLNYFLARLQEDGVLGDFYPLHGLWELREALERDHKDDGPNDAHNPGTAIQKYNAHVPAAAMWVIVLGKKLYDFEKDLAPKNPNQGNPGKGGELWKGKAEFSKERWGFWKGRFGEIKEMEEVSEETRNVAKKAAEAMNQAEGL